ncbi:MAG: hypothetical protein OXI26_05890 [bacterium]|nr:hypothetical protein [bacterium]
MILGVATLGVAAPAAGQDDAGLEQPRIVRITTPDVAGVYTVGWQTLGGCDPGAGTSGMAGEITLTVEATESADDTPVPGELKGTPALEIVIIRPICFYTWSVSLVEATTDANCIVGPAPFAPSADHRINITLADPEAACAQRSRIVVRLNPSVPIGIDDTDHNAILRTRFIATARRVEDAPRRCSTRSGISKVDDNDTADDTTDDTVSIVLGVVATTADGEECHYDVTLRVPRQLSATHGEHEHTVFENVDARATIDFRVGVTTKTIYLLQTVVGDSGGADARYELTRTCGEPDELDLPEPLLPLPVGGIETIDSVTRVELREGRYNITAALAADPSADDAFEGVTLRVLDNQGETCEATVSVSHLPEQCAAEETSLSVALTRAPEPTILEFNITCGDVAEAPESDEGEETSESGDADDTWRPGEASRFAFQNAGRRTSLRWPRHCRKGVSRRG